MPSTTTTCAAVSPDRQASAAPTAPTQRIELLDTLRGIAVLGILLINIEVLSGIFWLPQRLVAGSMTPLLDQITLNLTEVLAATKFVTLFSLLFGAGFALQLERGQKRGFFARRMCWLYLIGFIHAQIVWAPGDILRAYALLGLVLIAVAHLSNRALVVVGWTFGAFVTAAAFIVIDVVAFPGLDFGLTKTAYNALILEVYGEGGLGEIVALNTAINIDSYFGAGALTMVSCFGKFLLGVWMVRIGLFRHPERHQGQLNAWIRYGLIFGVPSSVVYVLVHRGVIVLSPALVWLPFVVSVGLLLHGLLYLALVIKYRNSRVMMAVARVLRPVGRMALTNYIFQSSFCTLLFYSPGGGLFGQVGHANLILICLGVFAVQIVGSHLWLGNFRYGPLEWIWRRVSYGQWRGRSPREPPLTTGRRAWSSRRDGL